MINPILQKTYYPAFGVNLNSHKLKYARSDFFIKIRGYGRDNAWADEIIKTADLSVNYLRRGVGVENVLKCVAAGVRRANQSSNNKDKKDYSGILRDKRENWLYDIKENNDRTKLMTAYINNKYELYMRRFDYVFLCPLKEIDESLGMTRMNNFHCMEHGHWKKVNNSLEYVFKLVEKIFPKYFDNEVKPENLDEINETIAEIRWVLAHATPWLRGSDAISNVFIRVIYKAIGIKAYPPAKDISFDLEAYCTNLDDYKKNFTKLFTKPPEIIE